jgi:hypothetical protein
MNYTWWLLIVSALFLHWWCGDRQKSASTVVGNPEDGYMSPRWLNDLRKGRLDDSIVGNERYDPVVVPFTRVYTQEVRRATHS